jgi:hypothetical protein
MSTLQLKDVKLKAIKNGGYIISYSGNVPSGATLTLYLSNPTQGLDVTGRNANDLLGYDNMARFLACIGKEQLWGRRAQCRLMVSKSGQVVAEAQSPPFDCPVRPYVGVLAPSSVGDGGVGPKLRYTGNGTGRMLHMPAIDGCYYFAWAGKFETSELMRGYDCTTYVGAIFGVDSATGAMGGYGTHLANHLGASLCNLENKTGDDIRKYFSENTRGTFLMWSDSHVVVVHNTVVHEFSQSKCGYVATPISSWGFGVKRYWVRKPLRQFC